MTESLRERCIEAGADVLTFLDDDDAQYHSALVLDAVLDVLEESVEEWIDEEWDRQVARWSGATREDVKRITSKHKLLPLLSVLRRGTE